MAQSALIGYTEQLNAGWCPNGWESTGAKEIVSLLQDKVRNAGEACGAAIMELQNHVEQLEFE